jgi:hypothetical protein
MNRLFRVLLALAEIAYYAGRPMVWPGREVK